jgi:hypothetical protein
MKYFKCNAIGSLSMNAEQFTFDIAAQENARKRTCANVCLDNANWHETRSLSVRLSIVRLVTTIDATRRMPTICQVNTRQSCSTVRDQ